MCQMGPTKTPGEYAAEKRAERLRRHKWDDDGLCVYCGMDGAEADYYSKRGYAHEYPNYPWPCPKAPAI